MNTSIVFIYYNGIINYLWTIKFGRFITVKDHPNYTLINLINFNDFTMAYHFYSSILKEIKKFIHQHGILFHIWNYTLNHMWYVG